MSSPPSGEPPTPPIADEATAPTLDPARAPTVHRSDRGTQSAELLLVAPPGAIPDPLKQWERYDLVRPLGQGGMGTVFLAKDRKLGRAVALKFLRVPSIEAAERLLQEARAQARLDHNNICKVFGGFRGSRTSDGVHRWAASASDLPSLVDGTEGSPDSADCAGRAVCPQPGNSPQRFKARQHHGL
ncbi:MAG: hypothetical protein U0787_13765 [Polyangia bacterium]